ncbi:MAG: biotin transporter BioY [Peptostreptococcus sp.]|uniref:biotin transporter BioY n=1 Tax=Peptostreptococcus sp. TaxID=1262 RepID=UPI002FCB74F4
MTKTKINTKTMILCSFFTALIAIGAFIRIPLPVTVFSLQFTFVLLSGMILGSKAGAISCLLYVVIGLLGFPIFTEGGGLGYILKPTFGYLIAFIPASYIVGLTREKFGTKSVSKLVAGCFLAMLVTYAIGTLYTYFILNKVAHTPIPYWACLVSLFPFAIAKDIFSSIIVSLVTPRLIKITNNHS